jgi:uncharacterized DUF497 family protein
VEIGYDPAKNARNIRERGLSFHDVATLDWSTVYRRPDRRRDYGETRMQAAVRGRDGKPYVVIYTMRGGMMWVISFRRAREREWRRYAKEA